MKKHPIDELFAKKLAEHRQEPSQKAFEKFQARLQEKQTKRRGGVFAMNRNWGYYAAAAGIVAALTIGVLSQRNTDDTHVAANPVKPIQVAPEIKPAPSSNQDDSNQLAKIKTNKESNTVDQVLSVNPANDLAVAKRLNIPAKAPIVKEITSPIEEESNDAIALNQPNESQPSPLQAETLTGRNVADIATYADNNSSIANKYNPGETVVVVITPMEETSVQSPVETETIAEKEKSFLAKLLGEYKHFKYGEKVDLKGIGVKDAMAKVDDNLFKEEREDVRDFVQRRIGRMQRRE
ncbi:hypothetical protein [Emticicia sp. C21]|uniref:hypothetical protein n=1 Tax=Emticicia sp. C21 TaxID=2302915 RepID=UPI000E884E88|nr:hypothetical protein [Emticicia sp. C21]RFS16156.1 hypothetical protein D0T08_10710 [Emticicia sp. C21]